METTHRTKVSNGGRIVIPSEYRKAMGLSVGDDVVIRLEKGELRLNSLRESVKAAQDLVRSYVGKNRSLADELIKERRSEAKRE
jgi:AbrB family looped-hinge helix DNA binding protein